MSTVALIGIDLSKKVYQLHEVNATGRCVNKQKLSRKRTLNYLSSLPSCIVAMEACAGSHYLGRQIQKRGHTVQLIAPQFVKPFVKGNKNDAADAEAICEAASRPSMRFVPLKGVWQQDLQSLHRIRQRLVQNRTALMNEIRGLLYEYGVVIPQGQSALEETLKLLLQENPNSSEELTGDTRSFIQELFSELQELETRIEGYTQKLQTYAQQSQACQQWMELPGVGALTATALAVVLSSPYVFQNGRQLAAYLGLVPRHEGTGGKNRLLGISKRGNPYLRTLLIHGARSGVRAVELKVLAKKKLSPLEDWVHRLYLKKGANKTAVALANKNARIAWALRAKEKPYEETLAAKPLHSEQKVA